MKPSKDKRTTFKDTFASFVVGNRAQFLEHQCYAVECVASKMLDRRSPEELAEIDGFLNGLVSTQTDVVGALSSELKAGGQFGILTLKDIEGFEYFAALSLSLVRRLRSSLQQAPNDSSQAELDGFQHWAEQQAGQSIEKALEAYVEFLFPSRQSELFDLLEMGFLMLLRKGLGEFHSSVLPAMPSIVKQILETPGIFEVLKSGIEEVEWRAKATGARKAGLSGHKRTQPVKEFAIARFREKKWPSARQAAIKIYPLVVEKFKNILSPDRAEITLQEWFLQDQKEQKAKK